MPRPGSGNSTPRPATAAATLAARSARRRRLWDEAYERFCVADAGDVLGPLDLDAMADAAFASGKHDEALAARERAYNAFVAAGEMDSAAAMAVKIANVHVRRGEFALVTGWLAKAERAVEIEPDGAGHGLLAWLQGMLAIVGPRDLEAADQLADHGIALGRELGDLDVEALCLALRAEIRAKQGRLGEAGPLLDDAMASALGSSLSPWVSCHLLCRTMVTCQELGDLRRAEQWAEAAQAASAREGAIPLMGDCRVHHAGLLNSRGAWQEAEREATRGMDELPRDRLHLSLACYELGEIRMRRGELAEAEAELERTHELGFRSAAPALAELRMAQGRTKAAISMLRNALEEETLPAARAPLLAIQVELSIAAGEPAAAESAAGELAALDKMLPIESVRAWSRCAAGAVALARGDARAACAAIKEGCGLWAKLGVPYRGARARLLLADAYIAREDPDAAELELQSALRTFERLGARIDAEKARASLRALAAETSADQVSAQRVRRAFMFTDIVNSTPLVSALGDDAWTHLLHWHDRTLRDLFGNHLGEEVDHAGDGFFVAFDSAAAAIRCAEDIQRKLETHRRENGFAPQVRIGVHVDDASHVAGSYKGRGVHVAARIGAQAAGGEILVSRDTLDAAGAGVAAGQPRTVQLKGVGQEIELLPVSWS